MNITKNKIQEIIDDNDNLIGSNSAPSVSPNKETEASKTTDYNAKVHGQNFKNDFLGRFGFYFYEAEGQLPPAIIADLMKELGSEEVAWKIMNIIKPHLIKTLDDMELGEGYLSEAKVVEDQIQAKKEDKLIPPEKKDKGLVGGKVERVADLLSKLPKAELDKLVNLLETKIKNK